VELIKKDYKKEAKRLTALRDRLYKGLQKNITDIQLNGHPGQRLPNNLNISFKYIEGESLTLNLDLKHICVATGSACTSGSLEPSHVLSAMGISPELSHGSIRFSLGRQNTVEEVDYVVQQTTAIVEKLRRMSPLA
ncbi:MAG: aminotransferase class V-fold PLP-dependent enzyme, partial [Candidatus Omnitrophica bacterium]|nr:aminotransferase class V-fold PLP-dependent enzyme [Candidatus Omnitrophota bacterium]